MLELRSPRAAYPERWLAAIASLLVVSVLAYVPAVSGGFIFDDNVFLTENPLIAASDGLRRFWFSREALDYWPVTSTTLWLEWRLWGANPFGYHVTNIALHAIEVVLFWALLRRLHVSGAWVAALLFAVHPLNAETVAWITQRKNLMASLFYLLSVHAYAAGEEKAGRIGRRDNLGPASADATFPAAALWYGSSLIAFTLAMLSKGSAVVLPLVLLGVIGWHRRPTTPDALRLAPFFMIAIALGWFESTFSTVPETTALVQASMTARLLRAAAVFWFYLSKAVWPAELCFDYGQWHIDPSQARWWLPLVAVFAISVALWRWRHPPLRPLFFCWLYFELALLPVMGFAEVGFMKYSPVSDHYSHLALLGICALVGAGLSRFAAARHRGFAVATIIAAACGLGSLATITWRQAQVYADGERLYRATLAHNPNSTLAHTNLGALLTLRGQFVAAEAELRMAVALSPTSAKAQDNLGVALYQLGRIEEAIAAYRAALRLEPDFFEAHNNLGAALARSGRLPEAVEAFRTSLRINPDFANARVNLERAERMMTGR